MEFIKIEHPSDARYVSTLKNIDGAPLIEVDVKDGDTLYLKFIRGDSTGTFKLDDLLQQVKCYAKSIDKQFIQLEDDSMFPIEPGCNVHSLMLRAFKDRNGLYYDRGFYPSKVEDRETYEKLRSIIYKYPLKSVSEFVDPLFGDKYITQKKTLVTKLQSVQDDELFGEWLLTQECLYYKKLLDLIMIVARSKSSAKYSDKTNEFLKAFRDYYLINQNLITNAGCYKGGVRRTPKVSRGRTHKRGMSGKNRRNHKTSRSHTAYRVLKQKRNSKKHSTSKHSTSKRSISKQKLSHRYRRI